MVNLLKIIGETLQPFCKKYPPHNVKEIPFTLNFALTALLSFT